MSATQTIKTPNVFVRIGRFLWGLFFLVVFFGGWTVIAFFAGGESMIDYVRVKTWDETVCTVRSAEMVFQKSGSHSSRGRQMYSIQTSYDYVVDGKTFHGSRYGVNDAPTGEFKRPARAEKYLQANPQVTCFYNPSKPSQSIIDRSFMGNILFVLLPLTFIFLFGGLMIWNVIKNKKSRRR